METSLLILAGDPWHRESLATALAFEGYHTEHTGDATCALALLAQHPFQLLLLDPSLPAAEEQSKVKHILELHPNLPVINLTPEPTPIPSFQNKRVSTFLESPLKFPALLQAVEAALPLVAAPARPATRPSASRYQNGPTKGRSRRILLVDDDAGVRASLTQVFQLEGYEVVVAQDGQQALALAAATQMDLVLLDLNLPVRTGWDTFERLSYQDPLLPVVVITARPNQLFTSLAAGVGALLEKPMDIPALLRTVQRLLEEPNDARLARLAGREAEFHYSPSPTHSA